MAPNSGDMLAIVARSGRLSELRPFAGKFDKAAYDSMLAQHLGHCQNQIGSGGAFGHCPERLMPMTSGVNR